MALNRLTQFSMFISNITRYVCIGRRKFIQKVIWKIKRITIEINVNKYPLINVNKLIELFISKINGKLIVIEIKSINKYLISQLLIFSSFILMIANVQK